MFIEREYLDKWMRRIMERFDSLEKLVKKPEKEENAREKERLTFEGELLLDNQDLCLMLNIGKRSLQRYRSLGWLQFKRIDQKTYYLKSEVERFIRENYDKRKKKTDN